jgi:hypothetical protein
MFLGASGHPDVKPGILEVGILLKTRFPFDQACPPPTADRDARNAEDWLN